MIYYTILYPGRFNSSKVRFTVGQTLPEGRGLPRSSDSDFSIGCFRLRLLGCADSDWPQRLRGRQLAGSQAFRRLDLRLLEASRPLQDADDACDRLNFWPSQADIYGSDRGCELVAAISFRERSCLILPFQPIL